ncbi:6-phosphogluconate dehydrogenase [Purpureocillium lavendulum]|uniref:6-phosphogluconate dehydrogenase n=1 Tax=Purpureocillium lavendulum TaxID=1247861 RepID=A0AB34G0P6_9HYPO|nr:6-phosphogluconate dehydrogenase [Purpureocillium lavendulum]
MSEVDATIQPAEAAQAPEAVEETPQAPEAAAPEPATEEQPKEEPATEKPAEAAEKNIIKTTAQIDQQNHRNNVKFDPSTRKDVDDPEAIRKQVEFYFGDWNFPQDKFMWESCEGTTNKAMPISKIHSFKRMRVFQPYSAVVAALRDSKFLVVEGEEGKEVIKRKVPYKPMAENRAKAEAATVYVKGFGDENPDTQFDLESFFAQYGEIKGLKLRRTPEGLFKGSVFVTFPDEDAAKKFIALEPAPKYKEHDLKIMSKKEYCDEKSELIRQGKLEPSSQSSRKFFEGRDPSNAKKGYRGKDGSGPRDRDDWKKRRDHDQKQGFQGGRGGRGRGRGGRGRGFGRGGRDNGGRDRERREGRGEERKADFKEAAAGDDKQRRETNNMRSAQPRIQSTAEEAPAANGKRSREDDGSGEGAPAAKKVDSKETPAAEA